MLTARTHSVTPPPKFGKQRIAELRQRLHMSQPVFADALNVSQETVKSWEQGKRDPHGAALRLLQIVDEQSAMFLDTLRNWRIRQVIPRRDS